MQVAAAVVVAHSRSRKYFRPPRSASAHEPQATQTASGVQLAHALRRYRAQSLRGTRRLKHQMPRSSHTRLAAVAPAETAADTA